MINPPDAAELFPLLEASQTPPEDEFDSDELSFKQVTAALITQKP